MQFRDTSTKAKMTNFLKINPGEEVLGVLRGEPVDFRQHWVNNRGVVCTGRNNGCEHCASSDENVKKSSFRFLINFVVKENGAYVAKVFSQGKSLYEDLRALSSGPDRYDLENYWVKIKRTGAAKETKYSVVPVPKGELTQEQKAQIDAVKLNELKP